MNKNKVILTSTTWLGLMLPTALPAQNIERDSLHLGEVVVVGYGTQRRTQLTGSVATIKADRFNASASPTLDGALGGAVAGLNVTAASGQPGAIESSLNPLSTINPSDIQSIEVLKDVSATAIYGSRGANGVILITTKKGARGKTTINYRFSAGWDAVAKKLHLMTAQEWAGFQKKYYNNKGGYTDEQIAQLGKGTDWQNAMLRNAFRQSHELSINGGNQKGRYAFSANYTNQDGISPTSRSHCSTVIAGRTSSLP